MTHPAPAQYPEVTWPALHAELAREEAARRSTYAGWVEKGRMNRDEADWQIALIAAIAADARAIQASLPTAPTTSPTAPAPLDGSPTWRNKRACILRELDYRARLYPQWIAKGRLTQSAAIRQTAALEAMLSLYEDGYLWDGPREDFPHSEIHTRRHPADQQEELTL